MNPLRLLLVDDSAEFLESAARLLALHQELRIVGRAASGSAALEQVAMLQPDLVLMDLAMPGMNGLETIRQARLRRPGLRSLLITGYAAIPSGAEIPVLHKPFTLDELGRRMAGLLTARQSA